MYALVTQGDSQQRAEALRASSLLLMALLFIFFGGARFAWAQSCGELGGDYCSQSGSCPSGYNSLGQTWDCNPCCQSVPQGPSCGELGGNWCSQSGSCPAGYESLGQTYDCNPCCQQSSQGQMSFSVYNDAYGSWSGGNPTVSGYSSVEDNSWGCSHSSYFTTTSLISPSGRRSSSGSPGLSSSTTLDFGAEEGAWQVVTQGEYYCSCIVNWAGFGGGVSFDAEKGTSTSCWRWTGATDTDPFGHVRCVYSQSNGNYPGCATCVPPGGVPKVHERDWGTCPQQIYWHVWWFTISGPRLCSPAGFGVSDPGDECICEDVLGQWIGFPL